MELTKLNELCEQLAVMRKAKDFQKNELDEKKSSFEESIKLESDTIKRMEEDIQNVQVTILEALKESGNKNWKTDHATVTRKSTITYKVSSKEEVLKFLDSKGLTKEYTTIELAPHAKFLYESIDVPGVDKTEKEFISVIVK